MKKLLKLQNDTISIKVNTWGFPEIYVYGDKFYEAPEFVGSSDKVTTILAGYISQAFKEMKKQNKKYLRINFDFCEKDYQKLQDYEQLGTQTELFND